MRCFVAMFQLLYNVCCHVYTWSIRIGMKITIGLVRRIIREVLEDDVEEQIDELREQPEFESIESFVEYKLDNEDYEYDFVELQALARNLTAKERGSKDISVATTKSLDAVKKELAAVGFKFIGRQPVKKVRGFTSPKHGSSPFAGMAGGAGYDAVLNAKYGEKAFTIDRGSKPAKTTFKTWDKDD